MSEKIIKVFEVSHLSTVLDSLRRYIPHVFYTVCAGGAVLFAIPTARMMMLKVLLRHRGWLHRDSGASGMPKTSSKLETRKNIYLTLTWLLGGSSPRLFSLQDALPKLPLPPLSALHTAYISAMRPLLIDDKFIHFAHDLAAALLDGGAGGAGGKKKKGTEAMKWQKMLMDFDRGVENWATDVLRREFLRRRDPLPVCSNWYGLDRADTPTSSQPMRVAAILRAALKFRRMIANQTLIPLRLQGSVPLCMAPYRHIFSSSRVPGIECDTLVTHNDANHIVIMRNQEFYIFNLVHKNGRWLTLAEMQQQVEAILADSNRTEPNARQAPVGILTSEKRNVWAEYREQLMKANPNNKENIRLIESALFCICLEDSPPDTLDDMARWTLFGHPANRWFDKSFQILVFDNGVAACNAEQSWADATVTSHVFGYIHDCETEYLLTLANRGGIRPSDAAFAAADGNPPSQQLLPPPIKLVWKDVPAEVLGGMSAAVVHHGLLTHDVELSVFAFPHFGKAFIKELQISPDAFVQMALQLAYYRTTGTIPNTLEIVHTRIFKGGRSDLVRSVSSQSVAFVKAIVQLDTLSNETKVHLLRQACEKHAIAARDAMQGRAIDRHLMGLKMFCEKSGDSFPAVLEPPPPQLLTAQAPLQRGTGGGLGLQFSNAGGTYFVSYLAKDDNFYFHITAKTGGSLPSVSRLGSAIESALLEMQALCNQCARVSRLNSEMAMNFLN